jgi:hypothetical protein
MDLMAWILFDSDLLVLWKYFGLFTISAKFDSMLPRLVLYSLVLFKLILFHRFVSCRIILAPSYSYRLILNKICE